MATTLYINTNALGQVATTQASLVCNSMFRFNGKVYGCNADGLLEHTGTDNNNVAIAAYARTFYSKLGHEGNSRVKFIYCGIESNGNFKITPTVDDVEKTAVTIVPDVNTRHYVRTSGRRDEVGAYWSYEISNVSGSWFSLDSINVLPVHLGKGRF